jgi:hypothetical protein
MIKDHVIRVRISEIMKAAIEQDAKAHRWSMSQWARIAFENYLEARHLPGPDGADRPIVLRADEVKRGS